MREVRPLKIDLLQQKQKIEAEIEERQKELNGINAQLGFFNIRHPKIWHAFDRTALLTSEPNSFSQDSPIPTEGLSGYKPLSSTSDIEPRLKDIPKPTEGSPMYNPQLTDEPENSFLAILLWLFVLVIGIYIIFYQGSKEKQKPTQQVNLGNVPALLGARDFS